MVSAEGFVFFLLSRTRNSTVEIDDAEIRKMYRRKFTVPISLRCARAIQRRAAVFLSRAFPSAVRYRVPTKGGFEGTKGPVASYRNA